MSEISRINPPQLAPAIAPFPQALVSNGFVFISGQVALDAANQVVAPGDSSGQTTYIIERIRVILAECGGSLNDLVTTTVFIKSPELFERFNSAWSAAFADALPARATVVADLVLAPLLIEVQATAVVRTAT